MTDALPTYEELQLRVRPGQHGRYRVEALAPDGSRASGTFKLPIDETQLDNFILQVGQPRRGVRAYRSSQMEQAKQLGARLFDALVAGEVRDLYRSARGAAEARGLGLRVTLCLTEAPTLMGVPWEFLFERPSFLAQSIYTPLVRSLDLQYVRPPHPLTLPLRILGVVSKPKGVAELQVACEQQKLSDALAPLTEAGLVRLDWLRRATLADLHEAVSDPAEIHVLHYIGHGSYDERTESGILVLEDDDGLRHEVTGEEFGSLLQDERSLRLVVLNSCEGARSSHVDPFSGVASSLVQFGIPAVIGMQFEITDEAAVTFADSLYRAVVQGYPIDAALAQARKAIFAARNDVEFGTPVLFLRAANANLFDFTNVAPLQEATQEAEYDLDIELVQRPPYARPGERITWQLTIDNTGGCPLDEVTARDESGDQLAAPVRLQSGTRHIVRWHETADAHGRRVITVTARDPAGSILSEQASATTTIAGEDLAHPELASRDGTVVGEKPAATADPRYLEGVAALYAGRFDEAVDRFATLAGDHPDDDQVHNRLEEARQRRDLATWFDQATSAADQEDWNAAVTALQRITAIDGTYEDAAHRLQNARHEQQKMALIDDIRQLHAAGQWTAALAAGEKLTRLDPDTADPDGLISTARVALADERLAARYTEGLQQLDHHDWSAALDTFTGIEQDRPGYRDTPTLLTQLQDRKRKEQHREQITGLQGRLRRQADQGDWVAVQATSNDIARLDPTAADPDGLATRAGEELAETRLAERYHTARSHLDAGSWEAAVATLTAIANERAHYRDVDTLLGTARAAAAQTPSTYVPEPRILNVGQWVFALAISPDGAHLATGSRQCVRMWDLRTGAILWSQKLGEWADCVHAVAFNPDGSRLAIACEDNTARIWDATTGQEQLTISHTRAVRAVAFSLDGTRLATGSDDDTARICDAATGTEQLRVSHRAEVQAVAFSPDGSRLATGGKDNTARIWDAATGTEQLRIRHSSWVWSVAFSPDGSRLATGSANRTASICDAATGTEQLRVRHRRQVWSVAFSPDGSRLASGSEDSTARISDVATDTAQRTRRHH